MSPRNSEVEVGPKLVLWREDSRSNEGMMRTALPITLILSLILMNLPAWGSNVKAAVMAAPGKTVETGTPILSFTEWKRAKIKASTERIRQLRGQYAETQKRQPHSAALASLQQEINQEFWNLEEARDLSPRDYLLLYARGSDLRLQQVASRLSPEEVSQFLESYLSTLNRQAAAPAYPPSRVGNQGNGSGL